MIDSLQFAARIVTLPLVAAIEYKQSLTRLKS
jgi:hypothetical protein